MTGKELAVLTPKEITCDMVYGWKYQKLNEEIPVETRKKLREWGYLKVEESWPQSNCWDERLEVNMVASLNYYWEKDRNKFVEITQDLEKAETRKRYRSEYESNSLSGIIGRGTTTQKRQEVWNSPTITFGTPARGARMANWLSEYGDIFRDGCLIELGCGPSFNLLETAKLKIFSQHVGVDALSVRETFLERDMESISKTVDIEKHIAELEIHSIKLIQHDVMKTGELKNKLPQLKRPITVLIANFFMYYSKEKVRLLLENISGIISPEYIAIKENLRNQGLRNSIDTSFSLVCRLDNSCPIARI